MDPSYAAPLATLASAIATAILMFAAYNWPNGKTRQQEDDDDDDKELAELRSRIKELEERRNSA